MSCSTSIEHRYYLYKNHEFLRGRKWPKIGNKKSHNGKDREKNDKPWTWLVTRRRISKTATLKVSVGCSPFHHGLLHRPWNAMKNRIKAKAVTQLSGQFSGLKVATENKTIKSRRQWREKERKRREVGIVMKRRDKRAEDKGECNSRVDGRFAVV